MHNLRTLLAILSLFRYYAYTIENQMTQIIEFPFYFQSFSNSSSSFIAIALILCLHKISKR